MFEKDALLRMVRTAMFLRKMADAYTTLGLDDNPHRQAYGDQCDAIYYLVGEEVDDFSQSVTYVAVTAPFLTDERRVELLWSEYLKHHPYVVEQPKPNIMSCKGMKELFERNGGYMSPEGDWP